MSDVAVKPKRGGRPKAATTEALVSSAPVAAIAPLPALAPEQSVVAPSKGKRAPKAVDKGLVDKSVVDKGDKGDKASVPSVPSAAPARVVSAPTVAAVPVVESTETVKPAPKRRRAATGAAIAEPAPIAASTAASIPMDVAVDGAAGADGSTSATDGPSDGTVKPKRITCGSAQVYKLSQWLNQLGPLGQTLTSAPSKDTTALIQKYLSGTVASKGEARGHLANLGILLPEVASADHKTLVSRSTFFFRTLIDKLPEYEKKEKSLKASHPHRAKKTKEAQLDENGNPVPTVKHGIQTVTTHISRAIANMLGFSDTIVTGLEFTERITEYIKKHDLKDPTDRRFLIPNAELSSVLAVPDGVRLSCFNVYTYLYRHRSSKRTKGLVLSEVDPAISAPIEAEIRAQIQLKNEQKLASKKRARADA